MPKILWDETFSVHNAEMDGQHQKWIDAINELHEALTCPGLTTLRSISEKSLEAMMQYVRYHFAAEEGYLLAINYPDLAGHKMIHEKFYVQIKGLLCDVKEGRTVLNSEIMKTMTNWLQNHILQEDLKYSRFAASLGR